MIISLKVSLGILQVYCKLKANGIQETLSLKKCVKMMGKW